MQAPLSDGQIGIRRFRADDVPLLFAAVHESIPELSTWMVWCHAGYSLEDSAAFVSTRNAGWEQGNHYSFVICDLRDDTFLGSVGLKVVSQFDKCADVGYWVRSSRAHQGIAPLAVRLVARFGFQELGFHRMELVMPMENQPGWRLAAEAGAKREGILRQRKLLQGKSHDAIIYSLVEGDLDDGPGGDRLGGCPS